MPAFLQYFIRPYKNYVKFDGRDSRKQYWMFILVYVILAFLIGWIPVVGMIYGLASIIPAIAAGIRRLHDTGKSGWYYALCLVPCVGAIVVIYFLAQPGETEANAYGEVPFDEIENGAAQ